MLIVEIFLNGFLHVKPCPEFRNAQGIIDRTEIRNHFMQKGYIVGEVRGVAVLKPENNDKDKKGNHRAA